jgi:hypothetical protein
MKKAKILNLVPQAENESSFLLKKSLSKLVSILDTVDSAGTSIGKKNLSTEILMSLNAVLMWLATKDARDSIPVMPSYEEYKAQVEKYSAACAANASSTIERRKAE